MKEASLTQRLIIFNRHNPNHNELELINTQRRTLVGDGYGQISSRRARALAMCKLATIYHTKFGRALELTTKGSLSLDQSTEEFLSL